MWASDTRSGTIRRCCRGSGGRRLRPTGARGSTAPCPTLSSPLTTTRELQSGRALQTTPGQAPHHCSWRSSSNGATAGRALSHLIMFRCDFTSPRIIKVGSKLTPHPKQYNILQLLWILNRLRRYIRIASHSINDHIDQYLHFKILKLEIIVENI